MKKFVLLTVLISSLHASPALAGEYLGPMDKLRDGCADILSTPLQIFIHTGNQVDKNSNKVLGGVGGVLEGIAQTAFKPVEGVFKILTFPLVD